MKPEIMKLIDLADDQKESVVSRSLLNKKTGTVTVFSFAAGQGLSEHTAPFDALVQIIDGEAEIIIDQELYILKAGEIIIMQGGKPHALHASQAFKMLLIMIRSE